MPSRIKLVTTLPYEILTHFSPVFPK